MKEKTVPATLEELDNVLDFINTVLEENDCPMKTQIQIDIAAEEIYVNIAHYSYEPGSGDATVSIDVRDGRAYIVFSDSGKPYNPLAKPDPDTTLDAEQRNIGGLGIYMVKKSMDDVLYEHRDGKNILTLVKGL